MFYVYRKKGPIREFTDDYIREKLRKPLNQEEAWKALGANLKAWKVLGDLNLQIDIPERIDLLDIDAEIDIQRLFTGMYLNVFTALVTPVK